MAEHKKEAITCPYCNFTFPYRVEVGKSRPEIITCPVDEGGCDRDMVIKPSWTVEVATKKIEGEEGE